MLKFSTAVIKRLSHKLQKRFGIHTKIIVQSYSALRRIWTHRSLFCHWVFVLYITDWVYRLAAPLYPAELFGLAVSYSFDFCKLPAAPFAGGRFALFLDFGVFLCQAIAFFCAKPVFKYRHNIPLYGFKVNAYFCGDLVIILLPHYHCVVKHNFITLFFTSSGVRHIFGLLC